MYLLERQRKILGLLLANEQRMTGSQIAQMIGITDRTVRNDIKDLNEGLKEYPDSYVESIRGKGYLLVSKPRFNCMLMPLSRMAAHNSAVL